MPAVNSSLPRLSAARAASSPEAAGAPPLSRQKVSARRTEDALESLQLESFQARLEEQILVIATESRAHPPSLDQCFSMVQRNIRKRDAFEILHRNDRLISHLAAKMKSECMRELHFATDESYEIMSHHKPTCHECFAWISRWFAHVELGVVSMPISNLIILYKH